MAVFIVRVGSSYGGSASVLPNEIHGGASSSTGLMTGFDGQADTPPSNWPKWPRWSRSAKPFGTTAASGQGKVLC